MALHSSFFGDSNSLARSSGYVSPQYASRDVSLPTMIRDRSLSRPRAPSVADDPLEASLRVAEFEREIETLDQKEMELHQAQLKLMRQQMSSFRKDLIVVSTELEEVRQAVTTYATLHSDLSQRFKSADEANRSNQVKQATIAEQLSYFEKILGDSVEAHTQDIQAAHGKIDTLRQQISHLEALKGSQTDVQKDIERLTGHHASQKERIEYLERFIGESGEKHRSDLEQLKALHRDLQAESRAHGQGNKSLVEQLLALQVCHSGHNEKLGELHRVFADHADKHGKELSSLRQSHGSVAGFHKDNSEKHATLVARLEFVERELGDSARRHAEELGRHGTKVDQMLGRQGEDKRLRDVIAEQLAQHGRQMAEHHATIEERVAFLERKIGDSADSHSRELATHSKGLGEMKQKHASVDKRIENIEQWVTRFQTPL